MKTTTEWVVQEKDRLHGKHWEDVNYYNTQAQAMRKAGALVKSFSDSWRTRVICRLEVQIWEDDPKTESA